MRAILGIGLLLVGAPVLAGQVRIDYDESATPGRYQTFRYVVSEDTSLVDMDPELHQAIRAGVVQMLVDAGLREVSDTPDLELTYHVTTDRGINFNTREFDYQYGSGWQGGLDQSQTTPLIYQEGSLVVDAWDAASRELIWRGVSTDVLTTNPKKQQKRLDAALKAMVTRWEKMKKQAEKRDRKLKKQAEKHDRKKKKK